MTSNSNLNWIHDVLQFISVTVNADVPVSTFSNTMDMLAQVISKPAPKLALQLKQYMRFHAPKQNLVAWYHVLKKHIQHTNIADGPNTFNIDKHQVHWGNIVWKFIHKIANVPDLEPIQFRQFINTMVHTLPCQMCAQHAALYAKTNPTPLVAANVVRGVTIPLLFNWSYAFHSHVNHLLGKPNVTFENAKTMYSTQTSTSENDFVTRSTLRHTSTLELMPPNKSAIPPQVVKAEATATATLPLSTTTSSKPLTRRVCGRCARQKPLI